MSVPSRTAELERLLLARLTVTQCFEKDFVPGWFVGPNQVFAPKLLLVSAGEVEYRLEEDCFTLIPGSMIHRPAWSVSRWRVVGDTGARMLGCEYLADAPELPESGPVITGSVEEEAFLRLVRCCQVSTPLNSLLAEAELKLLLAHFWGALQGKMLAPATHSAAGLARPSERAVVEALAYLKREFHQPDVLTGLPQRLQLNERTFQRAFVARVGVSTRRYVTILRMRAAWNYLHTTRWSVKEIAARVGYSDPLYFSRHFHSFWGSPPSLRAMLPAADFGQGNKY